MKSPIFHVTHTLRFNYLQNNIAQPIVAVDYELSGSRHEFLIESAVLTGKYVFAPIMKEMASIDGYVM